MKKEKKNVLAVIYYECNNSGFSTLFLFPNLLSNTCQGYFIYKAELNIISC